MVDFKDILAEICARTGVDLAATEAPRVGVRCVGGCGRTVAPGTEWCVACGAEDWQSARREVLADAYATLPDWPWADFANPNLESAVKRTKAGEAFWPAVVDWSAGKGGLILIGPTRSHKTALATAVLRRALLHAETSPSVSDQALRLAATSRFFSVPELTSAARRPPHGHVEHPIIKEAIGAYFAIFDELGREDERDQSIFRILDARYRRGRRCVTMITTRLSRKEMASKDRYGVDGERRIAELGTMIDMSGGAR